MAAAEPPPQDDSSSDDEGQAFYVGGSDRSGQQVLGPPRKKNASSFVERVLKNVRDQPNTEVVERPTSVTVRKQYFTGTGHRLGETAEDSAAVPGEEAPQPPREFHIRMWQNGFSIDDGPLRPYEESENRRFLEFVERGQIPPELQMMARGSEVEVNIEDKRHEPFQQGRQPPKSFAGEGRTLGSMAPTTVGMTADASLADKKANEEKAKQEVKVNPEQPTTNLQLRLADGSRIVAQFNHSHTIRDVRMFIVRARPQYEISPFSLMTAFPSKELTDEMATLSELNLLNAVIIQRVTG